MTDAIDNGAGLFIVIEGVDGAGKSTLLKSIAAALRAEGRAVVETREPGGAPGAGGSPSWMCGQP